MNEKVLVDIINNIPTGVLLRTIDKLGLNADDVLDYLFEKTPEEN